MPWRSLGRRVWRRPASGSAACSAPTAGNGAAAETADGDGVPFDVAGLLTRAEAKLDDAGEEDRNELIDLIEAIRDARKAGDRARLAEACEQLNDLIFYLET